MNDTAHLERRIPMSATATTEKKYLKWYQKLAYGSGDLASNCSYGLVSSFVLLYLTGTLGLDSAIIGSLMLASKVLDGISDVIFGTLIDRTHSKLGKARPWMLFGQVGVSLCLFLLFLTCLSRGRAHRGRDCSCRGIRPWPCRRAGRPPRSRAGRAPADTPRRAPP